MSDKAKILNEHLYGVHKEMIKKHHTFEKCLHQAMQSYADQHLKDVLEEVDIEELKTIMFSETIAFAGHRYEFVEGAKWLLNHLKNKNQKNGRNYKQ